MQDSNSNINSEIEVCTLVKSLVRSSFEIDHAEICNQILLKHQTAIEIWYDRKGVLFKDQNNIFDRLKLSVIKSKSELTPILAHQLKIVISCDVIPVANGVHQIRIHLNGLMNNSPFLQLSIENPKEVEFHESKVAIIRSNDLCITGLSTEKTAIASYYSKLKINNVNFTLRVQVIQNIEGIKFRISIPAGQIKVVPKFCGNVNVSLMPTLDLPIPKESNVSFDYDRMISVNFMVFEEIVKLCFNMKITIKRHANIADISILGKNMNLEYSKFKILNDNLIPVAARNVRQQVDLMKPSSVLIDRDTNFLYVPF